LAASQSTALIDLKRKKAAFQKFGVPSYWVVDPKPARPELTVFELRDGSYALEATSTRPLTMSYPFTLTVTPADLTKGLPR
jgi:Uma2 family endonuclease